MLLAIYASLANAAWHDEHRGNEVLAHYVHLSGHGANNEIARQSLREEREMCVKNYTVLGLPVAPMPAEGIPKVVHYAEVDLYYAQGRSAGIMFQRTYTVDHSDCSIRPTLSHMLNLYADDVGQSCTIDLIKRRANGLCLPPKEKGKHQNVSESPGIDLSRLPPEQRSAAERALEKIARDNRPAPREDPTATNEYRMISGYKCRVFRNPALSLEKCIASPESPFPIPPSYLNAMAPGLLLYSTIGDGLPTLTASEVRLNIGLSADAFAVPADILRHTGAR
jgi:hypothetical protein